LPTNTDNIEDLFSSKGGIFGVDVQILSSKLNNLKALILDWDGVFNDGIKDDDNGSPFSEVDSMGLNMFRFSFFLKHGFIPAIFIVTGENNRSSLHLSKREHFNSVYIKLANKEKALDHIVRSHQLGNDNIGFVFDDILDLGMAANVGLRFFINRHSNPMLNKYVVTNNLAEYYTANNGKNHAVREVCELCLGLLDNFNEVVENRVSFSDKYNEYLSQRNRINTEYFTLEDDLIKEYALM